MADHNLVIYSSTNARNITCSLDLYIVVKPINETSNYVLHESSLKISFSALEEYNIVHFQLPPYEAMTCNLSIRDCLSFEDTSSVFKKTITVLQSEFSITNGAYPHFLDLGFKETITSAAAPRPHSSVIVAAATGCLITFFLILIIAFRSKKKTSFTTQPMLCGGEHSEPHTATACEADKEIAQARALPASSKEWQEFFEKVYTDEDKENSGGGNGEDACFPLRPQDWCCADDMRVGRAAVPLRDRISAVTR